MKAKNISISNNKKIIIILLVIVIALSAFFIFTKKNMKSAKVCFKSNCFYVELATSPEQQKAGLMFRDFLDEDKGMLFVYQQKGAHRFWMKNTKIPLDIIWMLSNEVVFIGANAQPCPAEGECISIDPQKEADSVLEINAGLAEKMGLKIGDKLDFDF